MPHKCNQCPWGETYSNESDICDHCQNDPDTGWGGFTDHRLGKHFYSTEERARYEARIQEHRDGYDWEDD